jgi:hypothetical protein
MDQVDQVLDELRDQLAASRQEVETLKARLEAAEQAGPSSEARAQDEGAGTQAEPAAAESHRPAEAGSGAGEEQA